MIIKNGRFEFRYNKKEHDMNTQDSHIRSVPKPEEKATDDEGRFVRGGTILIKTYFMWKIADRVVEKVLR